MKGIIIADKPEGYTSFDVIARLRGALGERRLGHGGTLDPLATGVLPVFAGSAAKAVDLLPDRTKRYRARVRLGLKTDTADISGAVLEADGRVCRREDLEAALRGFSGQQSQLPPMYSAVKVGGRRLYELAREGKTAERKEREIEIFSLELLAFDEEAKEFELDVKCSKGTYIRTLAEDIAASAGCLAALAALRRTESSGFTEAQARPLEELLQLAREGRIDEVLLSVESAFSPLAALRLDDNLARLFMNGYAFEAERLDAPPRLGEDVRVYSKDEFLGLGRREGSRFKKIKDFR